MKYLKERQLAKQEIQRAFGFSPKLEDIVPLEAFSEYKKVTYVLFTIKGRESREYRATPDCLEVIDNLECFHVVL